MEVGGSGLVAYALIRFHAFQEQAYLFVDERGVGRGDFDEIAAVCYDSGLAFVCADARH